MVAAPWLMRDLCDAAGIDMQIVSLTAPNVEQLQAAEAVALARYTNNALAEAIARHPTRLSGFPALPIEAPGPGGQRARVPLQR